MVGGPSVWKAVLTRPTHPNLLDEILIWIRVVIHYRIGIGVVWAGQCPCCLPTHNRFMIRRDGLQKGNSGKRETKEFVRIMEEKAA